MKKRLHIKYVFPAFLLMISLLARYVSWPVYADEANKITICHATHSETNPYNLITVDDDSIFKQGHDQHQDHEDIIPPFDYGDGLHYDGLNWDSLGQSILNNGCNLPTPTIAPTPTFVAPTPTIIIVDPTITLSPTSTPSANPTVDPTITLSPTSTPGDANPTVDPATTAAPTIVVPTLTPSPTSVPSTSNNNTGNNSNNNSSNNVSNNNSSPTYSSPAPTPTLRIIRYQPKITVLGTTNNFNPLVDGIRQSYGGVVLGKSTELMATGDTTYSTKKLPSGNSLTDQKINIPSINLNQSVYLPQQIGDQLTVGHQEVLVTNINGSTVYYGHNSSSVFGSIFKLNNDDVIKISRGNLVLTYKIFSKENVSKFDMNSIQTNHSDDIVLVTCSKSIFDHRVIVKASLIK